MFRPRRRSFASRPHLLFVIELLEPRTFLSAPDDIGNSMRTATPISPGPTVSAVYNYLNDQDFFSFYVAANQTYLFTIHHPAENPLGTRYDSPTEDLYQSTRSTQFWDYTPGTQTSIIRADHETTLYLEVGRWDESGRETYDPPLNYTLSLKALTPADDDYANTPTAAQPIPENRLIRGHFDTFDDSDFFAIPAVAGRVYSLAPRRDFYAFNPVLYGPDGQPIPWENSTGPYFKDPLFFIPTQSGTYYFSVTDDAGNFYAFSLSSEQLDHPITPDLAFSIPLNQDLSLHFQFPDDAHYFHFHTLAGHRYLFTLLVNSPGNLTASIIESDDPASSTVIVSSQDYSYWTHPDDLEPSSKIFIAQSDADLLLSIQSDNSADPETASLIIRDLPDEDLHGAFSATAISPGTPAAGNLAHPAEINYFKFHAIANDRYIFTTSRIPTALTIVQNASDSPDTLWGYLGHTLTWNAPADGDYYLAVGSEDPDVAAQYTVTEAVIADDYSNDAQHAAPITLPAVIAGQLFEDDVDVFQFNATAGQTLILDSFALLLGPDGNPIYLQSPGYYPNREYRSGKLTCTLSQTGTYTLWLRARDYGVYETDTRNYRIAIISEAPAFSSAPSDAPTIDLSTSQHLTVSNPGEFLFFALTANPHDTYTITTTPGSLDPAIALFDTDGQHLLASDSVPVYNPPQTNAASVSTQARTIQFVPLAPGPFYLRLSAWDPFATGDFTISQSVTPDIPNTPSSDSPLISPDAPADANITYPGDVDVFRFHAQSGHTYIFSGGYSSQMAILDTDGQTTLASDTWLPDVEWCGDEVWIGDHFDHYVDRYCDWGNYTGSLTFFPPADGDYYLQVDKGYGARITEFDAYDDNGQGPSTATPLTLSSPVTGHIDYRGDQDFFSFQAEAGHSFILFSNLPWTPPRVTDPSGDDLPLQQVVSTDAKGFRFDFTTPASGTYYISLNEYTPTTYTLILLPASASAPDTPLASGDHHEGLLLPGQRLTFTVDVPAGASYRFLARTPDGSPLVPDFLPPRLLRALTPPFPTTHPLFTDRTQTPPTSHPPTSISSPKHPL
jgi:hypothetical protein